MNRTLRVLAITALLSFGLFMTFARLPWQPAYGDSKEELLRALLPGILVNLLGQTASALCLAVGVAALVVCFQRRQRGWGIGLLSLALLAANGPSLAREISPLLDNAQYLAFAPYAGAIPVVLVAIVVLVYTLFAQHHVVPPRPTLR